MHTVQAVKRGNRIVEQRFRGLARLFFAVADPTRIRILLTLQRRDEACVTDLADELGISVAAVSHHLRILRECRCLQTIRMGKMICYRFIPNAFTKFVIGRLRDQEP
ncbi:MAG: metalloregulator ArsR/SmtB family transcription factor [Patescibacteria group bacterium]|jgi:DNA-binding transcriptional ArsR family regulator